MKHNFTLKIGWLYPELMSTYGDRGNIAVLRKRCEWRGIKSEIFNINADAKIDELKSIDLIFGGGAQDREQDFVIKDLRGEKGDVLKELIKKNIPALFVCGSPQLMGNYYEPAEGKLIEGLGIFDIETRHPSRDKPRLIGNIAEEVYDDNLNSALKAQNALQEGFQYKSAISASPNNIIVGFENHGGRTFLGKNAKPFAKVIKGYGNNGEDGTEGVIYKNAIGTYLHGPLLPKNPQIADYLIRKALEIKYNEIVDLAVLDDALENKAREVILGRLSINY